MILTVGGIKGGSGKTTVATNFACIAAAQNADVLLVDADDQETASDFTAVRKEDYPAAPRYTCTKLSGKAVRTEILELAPKYDHTIVDTGGRDTTSQRAALAVSQLLLVPFVPTQLRCLDPTQSRHARRRTALRESHACRLCIPQPGRSARAGNREY